MDPPYWRRADTDPSVLSEQFYTQPAEYYSYPTIGWNIIPTRTVGWIPTQAIGLEYYSYTDHRLEYYSYLSRRVEYYSYTDRRVEYYSCSSRRMEHYSYTDHRLEYYSYTDHRLEYYSFTDHRLEYYYTGYWMEYCSYTDP